MLKPELAIVHFNPLEQYPPVMNFLKVLEQEQRDVVVLTMHPPSNFNLFSVDSRIKVRRYGKASSNNRYKRIISYFQFYFFSVLQLLFYRPLNLLYYETNSFLPVWIYNLLMSFAGKKVNIYCHYHEYTTADEYASGMKLTSWLNRNERRFYHKLKGISHTNEKRSSLFRSETGYERDISIFPNYPPEEWSQHSTVKTPYSLPLKLVYVGALDPNTMYVKEIAEWVKAQDGKITLDFYTNQKAGEAIKYLKGLNCTYITVKGAVAYYSLPGVLKQYDIGLVLYKGQTLNYVYNETNKLFEYLSCGLSVWYSDKVKGIDTHKELSVFPKVIPVNFESISSQLLDITRSVAGSRKVRFSAEAAGKAYLEKIIQN